MVSIDIISAAGMAYQKTWAERRYLLPMIIVPFLVNYFCFFLGDHFAQGDNLLRRFLIMVPAYFVEGWLLAHWVRTIVLGHRWPFRPTGDNQSDLKQLQLRSRGVLSGAVCYTLIKFLIAGFGAFYIAQIPADMTPETADPKIAMLGVGMLVATIIGFRYVWFYIPLAVNTQPRLFLNAVQKFSTTFPLLGVWFVCVIPAIMFLSLVRSMILGEGGGNNILVMNLVTFVSISIDMIKNLIVTAGLTIVVMQLLGMQKK